LLQTALLTPDSETGNSAGITSDMAMLCQLTCYPLAEWGSTQNMKDGYRRTIEPLYSQKEIPVLHEYLRQGNEPPAAIARNGWRYHHIGIPTQTPRPDEIHVPHLHIHVAGFQTSPFGVEWMRFDPDAPYPEAIKTIPHVAFEVDDLAIALIGQEILIPPNSPSAGVKVAMILDHGAPIELMQFSPTQKSQGEQAL
jgi:hypothetical protein